MPDLIASTLQVSIPVAGLIWALIKQWQKSQSSVAKLKTQLVEVTIQGLNKATEKNEQAVEELKDAHRELAETVVELDKTIALQSQATLQQRNEMRDLVAEVKEHTKETKEQLKNFRHALDNGNVEKIGKDLYRFRGLRRD